MADRPAEQWPAWRGGAAEGRVSGPLPTTWSGTAGIRWKTPIPGRGYSSPIVFGNRVYITTADATVSGTRLQTSLRWLTIALAFLLIQFSLGHSVARCLPQLTPSPITLFSSARTVALSVAIGVITSAGDGLFGVSNDPTRGWLMGLAVMFLCLCLAVMSTDRRGRLLVAAIGVVFGTLCIVGFPARTFIFRTGLRSLREQTALAVASAPVVLGCGTALLVAAHSWPARRRRAVFGIAAAAIAAAAVVLVDRVINFRDVSIPEMRYEPLLKPSVLAVTAAWIGIGLVHGYRSRSITATAHVLLAMAATILAGAIVVLEAIAARSAYLAYQLGSPSTTMPGLQSMALAGLAVLIGIVLAIRPKVRSNLRHAHLSGTAALVAALTVGSVYFVRINYAHTSHETVRGILSLDRATGNVVWFVHALEGPSPRIDGRNSAATPTPTTDGRFVCASFGQPGVMCATTDGQLLWSHSPMDSDGVYGAGSSPVLVDGILLISNDRSDGHASIETFDAATGTPKWTSRFSTTPTLSGNSRTPLVLDVMGEKAVVLWGMQYLSAFSLRSGERLWSLATASGGDLVSSATSDGQHVFLSDATGTTALDRAELSAGRARVLWRSKARSNCASPVVANGMLFTVTDSGIASSIETATGRLLWQHRLPGNYYASLVASADAVYFTNSEGLTTIVAAESEFRAVATNELGEEIMASMAAAHGELVIRSSHHVFAIAPPPENSRGPRLELPEKPTS